jgi:hypothetical protein
MWRHTLLERRSLRLARLTHFGLPVDVEHHMTEEETTMFPLAEAEVEEDLKDLRDEMLHLKAHLLAS